MPDGRWLFTSLEDLDVAIHEWESIRDRLEERRHLLERTATHVRAPADDIMSNLQTEAFRGTLIALQKHSSDLFTYADNYAAKLREARDHYASTEQGIADNLKGAHG